ncbi:MAG: hypothetical protein CVU77_01085 [Elusimicrobia bacterium HGW-Elusimicrobia-1]|jgi:hypothetical protein|nr:MAG: hypothetical protein CVU77_01085 [Elusimicrobia bacterium HGW-Elusimicrobia-1]
MPANNFIKAVSAAIALVLILVFGRLISGGEMFFVTGLVLALAAGAVTFLNPEHGLILLVFSMMLSPEIELAQIPGRSITVRIDDFLLIAVFISYVTYHAVNPHARKFVRTPIDRPLIAMIIVYFLSTAIGNIEGRLKPLASMFFVFKYVQYFILFWIASNLITSRETLKRVIIAGVVTAIIVCIYAYSLFPTVERVYSPFDHEATGRTGESATLGGYLIIIMSLALAFFANSEAMPVRLLSLGLFLFALPPFVRTLSRASYYAIAVALPSLVIFSPKRKLTLILGMLAFLVGAPVLAPGLTGDAVKRLQETFTGPRTEFGMDLELSAAARLDSWKRIFSQWLPTRPLLGYGATGVGLVDTQYPRILGEFGLIGFGIFAWLMASIFMEVKRAIKNADDILVRSVAAGFLAAFAGLLVQGIGVNTFIIVRIMTPFWFLLGAIVAARWRRESGADGPTEKAEAS